MNPADPRTICIACAIFRSELEALRERHDFNLPTRYLASMLHLEPEKLEQKLETLLQNTQTDGSQVLLLYGDCHPYMHEQTQRAGVSRIHGLNCPEILLGREQYRILRKEGVFFLMPEWTIRWKDIFQNELGLNTEVARDFMQDLHTRLLYLDTGTIPIPTDHLEAVSEFTGLPWDILPVSTGPLLEAIRAALERVL